MRNDIITHVAIGATEISDLNNKSDYFAATIKGDCLDHDDCPVKIKDGDLLLCRRVDRNEFMRNWRKHRGEIVLIVPATPNSLHINHALVKQFVGVVHGWFVDLRMFNPPLNFDIPIDEIKEISIVKKVLQA